MNRDVPEIQEILTIYQLHYEARDFIRFDTISPMPAPKGFIEDIDFGLAHCGGVDKYAFAAEFIIVPFLKATWRNHLQVSVFSHVPITTSDMTVIPDYLVTANHPTGYKTIQTPLLFVCVEARDEKFDEGWAQALLQTVICQKINNNVEIPIYAIVTTGDLWQFGKLAGNMFYKHPFSASIQDIQKLLGILDALFAACETVLGQSEK